ncbi:helix-turn-helix transcriptional regulator [Myceligenerans sp. I2]|uniref:Helix-turn-helix transcriptional regulator n=2 Tax=Myceligenerans indicum TaxID=2593663 RepID=A0ABS1LQU4_9MICO|nr:helix-turn-helix transcriptional regulator [Myceligenerans indicum]
MGLTQEGLAREIDVQPSTVGRWERGTTTPHLWARDRLCRALDLSRAELDMLLRKPGPGEPVRLLHVVEVNDDDGGGGEAVPAVGIA